MVLLLSTLWFSQYELAVYELSPYAGESCCGSGSTAGERQAPELENFSFV